MQIKTRVAAAIAIMGGPAFASGNPVAGNNNLPILSGNNVQIPVDICGNAGALLGFAHASCVGGAAALPDSFNP